MNSGKNLFKISILQTKPEKESYYISARGDQIEPPWFLGKAGNKDYTCRINLKTKRISVFSQKPDEFKRHY
ncbi:hypothetical protein CW304_10645 [Bacillus sp. UFRGS-B20]|nr:hypothetical protein CW304_10645 [Bacillus sp. UFRGS-B20]